MPHFWKGVLLSFSVLFWLKATMLSDAEIEARIVAPKVVVKAPKKWKEREGHHSWDAELKDADGHNYSLYARQNSLMADDFSCGLRLVGPGGGETVLVRYNGSSHIHTNAIEKTKITFQTHIHRAKAAYINRGSTNAGYAEATDRYTDIGGALAALISDCKITGLKPPKIQMSLLS